VVPRLHHAETIDPTLLGWILDEIDAILGLPPLAMVVLLGVVILALPAALATLFLLRRRTHRR
jgi:hypothetical protein